MSSACVCSSFWLWGNERRWKCDVVSLGWQGDSLLAELQHYCWRPPQELRLRRFCAFFPPCFRLLPLYSLEFSTTVITATLSFFPNTFQTLANDTEQFQTSPVGTNIPRCFKSVETLKPFLLHISTSAKLKIMSQLLITFQIISHFICFYIYIYMCVCVWERERERERLYLFMCISFICNWTFLISSTWSSMSWFSLRVGFPCRQLSRHEESCLWWRCQVAPPAGGMLHCWGRGSARKRFRSWNSAYFNTFVYSHSFPHCRAASM